MSTLDFIVCLYFQYEILFNFNLAIKLSKTVFRNVYFLYISTAGEMSISLNLERTLVFTTCSKKLQKTTMYCNTDCSSFFSIQVSHKVEDVRSTWYQKIFFHSTVLLSRCPHAWQSDRHNKGDRVRDLLVLKNMKPNGCKRYHS